MIDNREAAGAGRRPGQSGTGDVRSLELAAFLRRRRESLSPADVGLPMTRRRRTPGLRREEVAERADISTSLYTWLEQGRDIAVSKRTIEAIASALALNAPQRHHLFALANPADVELDETVTPALRRFIDSLNAHPVFVLDHAWDIVARNAASVAVFGSASLRAGDDEAERHNFLEHIFLDPSLRERSVDWENLAADIVAMYRYHFALYTDDARSIAVIENLQTRSPEFAGLWEKYRLRAHPRGQRAYRCHPAAGMLNFEPTVYGVMESAGLRMIVYTPFDDLTTQRIEALLRTATPARANAEPSASWCESAPLS